MTFVIFLCNALQVKTIVSLLEMRLNCSNLVLIFIEVKCMDGHEGMKDNDQCTRS